ncbi:putative tyrosine-protein phosphatase [Smittium culicis]|uniref:Putative tyrosine-protein phosphatase n=1 Tax=Smittium culicis TaxID=133412 RepID=A0A1R1XYP9_9FUNG|nr:putative tyrosine-protein phosphatase [Smittium culicis]OMJ19738.1 putative tyrosine-protein phosphatase [Smittium culicis]
MYELNKELIKPPEIFGLVEEGVYRCNGTLDAQQVEFLEPLEIKTILLLSIENVSVPLQRFVKKNNINQIQLGLKIWQGNLEWKPVSEELVKEAVESILDTKCHPLLLVCSSGVRETGIVVGCLRKLQKWNFNSIVFEYRRYSASKSKYAAELFIELFDTDLVNVPSNPPLWFN